MDGGGGGTETKTYARLCKMRLNSKMQLSTQCRASGAINISKNVNNFLSTNPSTFILSSLVSEIDKESNSECFCCCCWGDRGGGGGGQGALKPKQYARRCQMG